MFYECTSLQGTANFKEKYTDARMANPERGYFSRHWGIEFFLAH